MKNDRLTHFHNFGYFVLLILTFNIEKLPCIHCFLAMLITFYVNNILDVCYCYQVVSLYSFYGSYLLKVDCVGVNT